VTHIAAPQTLQAALTLAYQHRKRTRWLVGKSELLRLDYGTVQRDAFIIDARGIADFRAIEPFHDGLWSVGVFASLSALDHHREIGRALVGETEMPLLRLLGLEAKITIGMPGTTRTVPLESIYAEGKLAIDDHEVPIALEVPRHPPGLAFAERRRATSDREASFDLRLLICMKVGSLGRIETVRMAVALDGGGPVRATPAEERLANRRLEDRRAEADAFGEAARLAAQTFPSVDAKTSAAARALPPLMLSALKEAYGAARRGLQA
jgi:CO/xanthine dehydrogenase FAD-binding subunit